MSDYLYSPYEATIWTRLMAAFANEYAVAGMMGWMVGESSLEPPRCEGTGTITGGDSRSLTITSRITSYKDQSYELGLRAFAGCNAQGQELSMSDPPYYGTWWVNGRRFGPGYGLAQWTGAGRKKLMYDFWYNNYPMLNIGSAEFQCIWLVREMRSYYGACYRAMGSATSVRDGMYTYGYYFETGQNSSWASSITSGRIGYGNALYRKYAGSSPSGPYDPPIDPDPDIPIYPPSTHKSIPAWLLYAASQDRRLLKKCTHTPK